MCEPLNGDDEQARGHSSLKFIGEVWAGHAIEGIVCGPWTVFNVKGMNSIA